ncbi:MAG: aminomethyl-transferring glycine dehydrogenase subunit 1 [Phycisphaerales bacterium]
MDYTSIAPDQQREMLETIGVDSIDALFECIPPDARVTQPLDLPPSLSELELQREIGRLSSKNRSTAQLACFAGGGAYDHFIPAFIDQLISRGEFLTAYTPYQGEASQGSLQAFFEFQTQVARLTGMDIANASLYEGASSAGEGVLLALNATGKHVVLIAGSLHPDYTTVLRTILSDLPVELRELPVGDDGVLHPDTVRAHAGDDVACLVQQSPNARGLVEDWSGCFAALKQASTTGKPPLAIAVCNPIACALLKNPGACGADVAVGEGQPLGIPLQLGGPYLGLFAAKKDFLRKMPGRLVGMTTDAQGRRSFCLSLQTREQHIRGAKATSNVCTNQGLLALRATMYMSAMGRTGLREVAEQSWHKAHDLCRRIEAIDGFSRADAGHFFHEFVVTCPVPAKRVVDHCKSRGILAGIPMDSARLGGNGGAGDPNELLVAVTEKRSAAELDAFVHALSEMKG